MKKFILSITCIAAAAIIAGCSAPRKAVVPEKQQPSTAAPAAETGQPDAQPAQPAAPPALPGSVSGTIMFDDSKDKKGNLFIFIMDDSNGPDDYNILAHTFVSAEKVNTEGVDFSLENVPSGKRAVIGVWDTSEPYCDTIATYCEASARDGIGMSSTFHVIPEKETANVKVLLY